MWSCSQEVEWSIKKRLCGKLSGRGLLGLKKGPLKDVILELIQKLKGRQGRERDLRAQREGRMIIPPFCRGFYNLYSALCSASHVR